MTYPDSHHLETDRQKLIDLIRNFPLAMLVSSAPDSTAVTHLPVMYQEGTSIFTAHLDRRNPQARAMKDGQRATLVFRGPDAYLSPSVFETRLPTWDYMAVHITGAVTLIPDKEAQIKRLIALTEFLEAPGHNYRLRPNNEQMHQLIGHITTFDLVPARWEGRFKLSAHKPKEYRERAKELLLRQNSEELSAFLDRMYG